MKIIWLAFFVKPGCLVFLEQNMCSSLLDLIEYVSNGRSKNED